MKIEEQVVMAKKLSKEGLTRAEILKRLSDNGALSARGKPLKDHHVQYLFSRSEGANKKVSKVVLTKADDKKESGKSFKLAETTCNLASKILKDASLSYVERIEMAKHLLKAVPT